MKKILVFLLILFAPQLSRALEGSPVSVDEMVFCRGINQRMPIDVGTHFPDSVGRVFCHTKISAAKPPSHISHVWYYNDVRIALVDLSVKADNWRTWSSKSIIRDWTGTWRVDVISEDGVVIHSGEFVITPAPN